MFVGNVGWRIGIARFYDSGMSRYLYLRLSSAFNCSFVSEKTVLKVG